MYVISIVCAYFIIPVWKIIIIIRLIEALVGENVLLA